MASGIGGAIGSMMGGVITGGLGPALGAALPSITDTAKILVDRLIPDPNAEAEAQAAVEQALAAREVAIVNATMEIAKAQTQVNLVEA